MKNKYAGSEIPVLVRGWAADTETLKVWKIGPQALLAVRKQLSNQ
ncbi:MAG: hypothetical protein ABIR76_11760 [Polaromonas sp.]